MGIMMDVWKETTVGVVWKYGFKKNTLFYGMFTSLLHDF